MFSNTIQGFSPRVINVLEIKINFEGIGLEHWKLRGRRLYIKENTRSKKYLKYEILILNFLAMLTSSNCIVQCGIVCFHQIKLEMWFSFNRTNCSFKNLILVTWSMFTQLVVSNLIFTLKTPTFAKRSTTKSIPLTVVRYSPNKTNACTLQTWMMSPITVGRSDALLDWMGA